MRRREPEGLIETSFSRGRPPGASASNPPTPQKAPTTPNAPPAKENTNASVTNCRIRRLRVAPSALRMASSRSRTEACASRRFATFAHATSSSKSNSSKQHKQSRPRFAGDRFQERNDRCIFHQKIIPIGRVVINPACNRADVCLRLRHGRTIAQTPHCVVIMRTPAGILALAICRYPHHGISGKLKSRGHHAHHGVDGIINLQGVAATNPKTTRDTASNIRR